MGLNARGQSVRTTHYDRISSALEGGRWKLVPQDEYSEHNHIIDMGTMKVGEVHFDAKYNITSGAFYGKAVVVGRVHNSSQACSLFEQIIEEIHVKR